MCNYLSKYDLQMNHVNKSLCFKCHILKLSKLEIEIPLK